MQPAPTSLASSPSTAVRLGSPGAAGTSLYNSYQFLAQLAGLFIKARTGEAVADSVDEWIALSDSALTDLGTVVNLWEGQVSQVASKTLEEPRLAARVVRLCRRAERIERLTNIWTSSCQWVRLVLLCELHWARLLEGFCKLDPALRPQLVGPIEGSKRRLARLGRLKCEFEAAARNIDSAYSVPETLG